MSVTSWDREGAVRGIENAFDFTGEQVQLSAQGRGRVEWRRAMKEWMRPKVRHDGRDGGS